MWNRSSFLAIVVVLATPALAQSQSLSETFDWISNTLKPSEANNRVIHRPYPRPYVEDWVHRNLDPYHEEAIKRFVHEACRVEFDVDVTDNDIGLLIGKIFLEHDVETFDLKDIDPSSIAIQNSCAPVETSSGPTPPWNCEDEQGRFLIFHTKNAETKIHVERSGSSWKSQYRPKLAQQKLTDELCKQDPTNGAYCNEPEHKTGSEDLTSSTLGFATPEYANRFAKALRHAVVLCGGKPSNF